MMRYVNLTMGNREMQKYTPKDVKNLLVDLDDAIKTWVNVFDLVEVLVANDVKVNRLSGSYFISEPWIIELEKSQEKVKNLSERTEKIYDYFSNSETEDDISPANDVVNEPLSDILWGELEKATHYYDTLAFTMHARCDTSKKPADNAENQK